MLTTGQDCVYLATAVGLVDVGMRHAGKHTAEAECAVCSCSAYQIAKLKSIRSLHSCTQLRFRQHLCRFTVGRKRRVASQTCMIAHANAHTRSCMRMALGMTLWKCDTSLLYAPVRTPGRPERGLHCVLSLGRKVHRPVREERFGPRQCIPRTLQHTFIAHTRTRSALARTQRTRKRMRTYPIHVV